MRARRPKSNPPSTAPKRGRRCAPRPLHVQQLAAGIVAGSLGLDKGHIGHVCDALTSSGLNLTEWTAKTLLTALNQDMKTRGWDWPNRIDNPAAFLGSRLRLLAQRPAGALRGGTAAGLDQRVVQPAPFTPVTPLVITPAQQAVIAAAQAEIRTQLRDRRQRFADRPQRPHEQPVAAPLVLIAASGNCAVCGAAGGQKRPFLPAHRAHVCAHCWESEAPA
ncbi:MAG: hypothetical protein E6R06_26370 [Mycobacterium sp.]|nr:MAG: hypothetical protein E6R06_26370 [Mycobacterium sp.]